MKKVLSLVLVLALVLGMMPVFAADGNATGAEMLYKYGFIAGNNGDLMVNKALTRAEYAVLVAEMNGLKDEAANYAAPANFNDVEAGKWYAPYVAYGQAQGWFAGYPDGSYKPEAEMSGQEFAAALMNVLKYDFTWNTVVADAAAIGVDVNTAGFNRGAAFEAMWSAVNMPVKGEEVALGVKLGRLESAVTTTGPLTVQAVTANTAKSFEVKFKYAVEDASKVAFEVKRSNTKVALTVAWNEAKTAATLSSSAKLPEGDYEIVVNDASTATPVALGTFKVTIDKEKIASVEFDSDTIMRTSDIEGVVGYKVLNQYGEDVTNGTIGRGISWITSTQSYDADEKAGILTVTQGKVDEYNSQLRTYDTVVITAQDTSVGFAQTKTFKVSDTINVVQDVKINGIVDENDEAVTFAYDPAKTFYLDVTALDANGKEIKSYAVLSSKANQTTDEKGEIVSGSGQYILDVKCSNGNYITLVPEKHPKDSSRMAYRLDLIEAPDYDTPITFIALATFSGKSSNYTAQYGRDISVEKFVLQSPAITVSSGKNIEFPFEAFDQYGNPVTDFDKLDGKINISNKNVKFVRQADGSAKLFGTFENDSTNDITEYISATINQSTSGSYSQISVVVKKAAHPETIQALTHNYAYTKGGDWNRRISNFKIYDQYDNLMNLRNDKDNWKYALKVTTSDKNVIGLRTNDSIVTGTPDFTPVATGNGEYVVINKDTKVYFTGGTKQGSATISYELGYYVNAAGEIIDIPTTNPTDFTWKKIDDASATAYNIDPDDITSAYLDFDGQKILMLDEYPAYYDKKDNEITQIAYEDAIVVDEPTVYGKTSSGKIVRVPDGAYEQGYVSVSGFTVSSNKFSVLTPSDYTGEYEIIANGDFGNDKTAEATVTGIIYGTKGTLQASAKITAIDEAPKATDVYFWYSDGALRDKTLVVTNDIVELTADTMKNQLGGYPLFYYNSDDGSMNATNIIDAEVDTQYGESNGIIDRVTVTKIASESDATFDVLSNKSMMVVNGDPKVGDEWSVTITSGSLSRTIVLKIVESNN